MCVYTGVYLKTPTLMLTCQAGRQLAPGANPRLTTGEEDTLTTKPFRCGNI